MSRYYPQALMSLRIIWEDYKEGAADGSKAEPLLVVPASVEVEINDYTTADTFTAEVEYRHFPFDPRTIRSMGVTIHIQDMKKIAYGDDRIAPSADNIAFIGFADESEIELDDDSRIVRFRGRDQSSLFIDAQWDGSLVKIEGIPVTTAIQTVMARLKSATEIKLEPRLPKGQPIPTLAAIKGSTLGGNRNSGKDETYWDVIQDLATRAGLICFMEVDKIVLTVPNIMYERKDAKQFIYGRNISDLKMTRKIGRMKDVNLRLLSLNHRVSPPVLEAFIPKDATASFRQRMNLPADHLKVEAVRVAKKKKSGISQAVTNFLNGTSGEAPEVQKDEREIAPFIVFRIPHARSKAHLVQIGEEIFETMSRQQIEGSFSTHEMNIRDDKGIEFDLLKLRVGTPVDIRIDNDDLTGIRDIDTPEERTRYLLARGYDSRVAKALSTAIGGFGSPFYTRACSFKLSGDGAFKLDIQFINFIELSEKLLKGK